MIEKLRLIWLILVGSIVRYDTHRAPNGWNYLMVVLTKLPGSRLNTYNEFTGLED